jgi:hypothetical protein
MNTIATVPPDSKIPTLFRQWIDAQRAAQRVSAAKRFSQVRLDAACELIWTIERRIVDTSSQDMVELALKAYLCAHHGAEHRGDPAGLSALNLDDAGNRCIASMVRDAARLVPEIAELVAPILSENETKPAAAL